jgi:hypothetical protein
VIQAYETRANSWYSGLQASIKRAHANGYSYYVGYTLSSSERDTEDFRFLPQDQRDYAGDRGPGVNDSRHRLVANATADLPWALRIAGVLTARSALPYNITTGGDDNGDTFSLDRPPASAGTPLAATRAGRRTSVFRERSRSSARGSSCSAKYSTLPTIATGSATSATAVPGSSASRPLLPARVKSSSGFAWSIERSRARRPSSVRQAFVAGSRPNCRRCSPGPSGRHR